MIHYLKQAIPSELKDFLKKNVLSRKAFYNKDSLSYLKYFPRYHEIVVPLMGKQVRIVDSASFLFMYKEIFEKEIFNFKTPEKAPCIIDGGANIGLATLYFKKLYPEAKIIAFEPDPKIFKTLEENIVNFNLTDVILINKALSDKESYVDFYCEGADGGRINTDESNAKTIKVPTTSLREYLNQKEIHFLKLDIEGAEIDVLNDIKYNLQNVKMIFIEYHSFANKPQRIDELVNILTSNNYRVYINAPGLSPNNPFLDIPVIGDMDMQLNVYAIRK